jgi:hypothetical protein
MLRNIRLCITDYHIILVPSARERVCSGRRDQSLRTIMIHESRLTGFRVRQRNHSSPFGEPASNDTAR